MHQIEAWPGCTEDTNGCCCVIFAVMVYHANFVSCIPNAALKMQLTKFAWCESLADVQDIPQHLNMMPSGQRLVVAACLQQCGFVNCTSLSNGCMLVKALCSHHSPSKCRARIGDQGQTFQRSSACGLFERNKRAAHQICCSITLKHTSKPAMSVGSCVTRGWNKWWNPFEFHTLSCVLHYSSKTPWACVKRETGGRFQKAVNPVRNEPCIPYKQGFILF